MSGLLASPAILSCGEDGGAPARDADAELATDDGVVDTPSPEDVVDTPAPPGDLGPDNSPPVVELLAPEDGSVFAWAESVTLRALVTDDIDASDALSARWSSPVQGVVFEGAPRDDGLMRSTAWRYPRAKLPSSRSRHRIDG